MRRPDKSSIWGICNSTMKHRERRLWNYIIPLVFGIVAVIVTLTSREINADLIRSVLGVLLALNGAVLGLLIAGFAFSNAIPKSLMGFFASSKADDYPWSNFKQILLNYVYCYTVLFSGILIYLFIYLLSYVNFDNLPFISSRTSLFIFNLIFAITWLVQAFILSELKIFLFWIYENSLLLGQAVAVSEDLEPYDDGNA